MPVISQQRRRRHLEDQTIQDWPIQEEYETTYDGIAEAKHEEAEGRTGKKITGGTLEKNEISWSHQSQRGGPKDFSLEEDHYQRYYQYQRAKSGQNHGEEDRKPHGWGNRQPFSWSSESAPLKHQEEDQQQQRGETQESFHQHRLPRTWKTRKNIWKGSKQYLRWRNWEKPSLAIYKYSQKELPRPQWAKGKITESGQVLCTIRFM